MAKDKCGIYSITNLVNNKMYIGQSKYIYQRWKRHRTFLNLSKGINPHLQNAWNKYGEENFKFSILEECNKECLNEREIYFIKHFDTNNADKGYNIMGGGSVYGLNNTNSSGKIFKKLYQVDSKTNSLVRIWDNYLEFCMGYNITKKTLEKILLRSNGKKRILTFKGFYIVKENEFNSEVDYREVFCKKPKPKKEKPPKIYKPIEERNIKRNPITLKHIETQEIRHFKSHAEAEKELGFKIQCLVKGFKDKGKGRQTKITQWKGWTILR